MSGFDCVVWDFDGVLNANMRDGRFVWADTAVEDIGHGVEDFLESVFTSDFDRVICGQVDILDKVREWTDAVGFKPGPEKFLDYWFKKDALPDPVPLVMMDMLAKRGVRHVIATNNEARRADYIETEMGFGKRVEQIFCSGRLGVAKPDPVFFIHVHRALEIPRERLILIDDKEANIEMATGLGWQGYHYSEGDHAGLRARLGL